MTRQLSRPLITALAALALSTSASAQEKLTYMTNWLAQAEHGGFYQAVATGIYRQHGLDVTLQTGGPRVDSLEALAAGQADCVMGGSDMQLMAARVDGLPVVTVAAVFQKDPHVFIAHEHVKRIEDVKDKTLLIAPASHRDFWPWLKKRFDLQDAQTRPYTYNIQPFLADKNAVQQGYLTSEPYEALKAGVKVNTFLFADHGWTAYSTTISCLEDTLQRRGKAIEAFVKASMEGWKSFLANPAPAAALIKKDNPAMTDEQIAYSVAKLKEMDIITGGDAKTRGIGAMDEARLRRNYAFLVENKLIEPGRMKVEDAFRWDFIKAGPVLP